LQDVDAWLQRYRTFYEESFDRLDDYLREIQAEQRNEASAGDQDQA
jgi:hypothetical protein